jgi:hypothetical protein
VDVGLASVRGAPEWGRHSVDARSAAPVRGFKREEGVRVPPAHADGKQSATPLGVSQERLTCAQQVIVIAFPRFSERLGNDAELYVRTRTGGRGAPPCGSPGMYASTTVTKGRAALNSERPSMQGAPSPRYHRGLPQGGAPPPPCRPRSATGPRTRSPTNTHSECVTCLPTASPCLRTANTLGAKPGRVLRGPGKVDRCPFSQKGRWVLFDTGLILQTPPSSRGLAFFGPRDLALSYDF